MSNAFNNIQALFEKAASGDASVGQILAALPSMLEAAGEQFDAMIAENASLREKIASYEQSEQYDALLEEAEQRGVSLDGLGIQGTSRIEKRAAMAERLRDPAQLQTARMAVKLAGRGHSLGRVGDGSSAFSPERNYAPPESVDPTGGVEALEADILSMT